MAGENVFPKSDGDVANASEYNALSIVNVTAGEDLTAGNVVYIKKSDGKAYISDTGTADDIRADGIVLNTVTTGNTAYVQTRGNYVTSGLTAGAIYYLGATGSITTTQSGVQIGIATSTTNLFINIVQDDRDPVGTIKPWHKDMTGMPSNMLTAFWVECNGQTLSDPESPFDGQVIPDLNGNNNFLRGNSTSGGTGGSATHNHQWAIQVAGIGGLGLAEDDDAETWQSDGTTQQDCTFTNLGANGFYTKNASTLPPYYNVVWIMKIK
jgi:hypothetical protein